MAEQYVILSKAQARARRQGIQLPEVTYRDGDGQALVVVDPSLDDLANVEETAEVEKPKAKKTKSKPKKKAVEK